LQNESSCFRTGQVSLAGFLIMPATSVSNAFQLLITVLFNIRYRFVRWLLLPAWPPVGAKTAKAYASWAK
jgi:hypothetical protein